MDAQDEKRLRKLLDDLGFLDYIEKGSLKHLLDAARKDIFNNGEMIIRKDEWGDSFFIISKGNAKVFVGSIDEKIREVKSLGEGDFFGEIALVIREPRTAWVVAQGDVEAFSVKKDTAEAYLFSVPEIREKISAVAKARLGPER